MPVIFLMGPTAAGKTGLAIELARRWPCDIISVDSALVYRGLDIGTAKPGPEIRQQIPHRLIDIRDPVESYSAAEFCADALAHIEPILAQGRIPLLVGGTMLYFRALAAGLSPLPTANAAVRGEIECEAEVLGWHELHKQLAAIDPESARRIHRNDPQRIQRALEVYRVSGRTMTEWYRDQERHILPHRVIRLIIAPEQRSLLHDRIARRFHAMLDAGFLAEVETLFSKTGMHEGLPSMRTVGYRQLWAHLMGQIGFDQAVMKGITATRQLAKRQMTWLRSERDGKWFDGADKNVLDKVLKSLEGAQIVVNDSVKSLG